MVGLNDANWNDTNLDPDDAWTHDDTAGTVTKTAAGSNSSTFYPSSNANKFSINVGEKLEITITASAITAGEFKVVAYKILSNSGLVPISKGAMKPGQLTYTYTIEATNSFQNGAYIALQDELGTGAAVFTGITVKKLSNVELHGKGGYGDEDGTIGSSSPPNTGITGFSYTLLNQNSFALTPTNYYNVTFDWERTSGMFEFGNRYGTSIMQTIDNNDGNSGSVNLTFLASDAGLSFRTSTGNPFNGKISNFQLSESAYVTSGSNPIEPLIGFSSINMYDIENSNDLARDDAGIISSTFTFAKDANNYPDVQGISIFKGDSIKGKLGNFSITDITTSQSANEVGVSEKWLVNTSETDNTITTNAINNNYIVESTPSIDENLYIHSKTVAGIRYAVKAANFNAVSSDSNITITKTDLGVAGTYDNVVKINITRTFNSGDKFPSENTIKYITVTETGDGVILATDQ